MTFEQFMEELIQKVDSKDNLENYYNELDESKEIVWKKLVGYLKDNFGDQLTYEGQFTDNNSNFFKFLNDNVDLNDYEFTAENQEKLENFWNESVARLVEYYYDFIEQMQESTTDHNEYSETQGKIPIGSYSMNTEDIKQGDAGNSFDPIPESEPIEIPKWVKPWYNAERYNQAGFKSYYEVRNNDLNQKAVSDNKNLQFTREYNDTLTKWLRLLMPKNSRRVEVEDLNRNFWVISSSLTGVVGYLFDENSPYQKIIKGALSEILELWENTIYLWASLGLISQKTGGIRTIMLPIPNSEWQSYNKYDGFGEVLTEDIQNRIKFLPQKYKGFDLIIVPYNRIDNYCKNYYSEQSYPLVIFYNSRNKTFKVTLLKDNNNENVKFIPNLYADRLFAIRETDTYYQYSYPVERISTLIDSGGSWRYCGGLRIIPKIEAKINGLGKIEITQFSLTGIDAARKAIRNEDYTILKYNTPITFSWTEDTDTINLEKTVGQKDITGEYDLYKTAVHQALYFGEFPTVQAYSQSRPEFVYDDQIQIIGTGKLIKIGNYLPQNFYYYPASGTKYYQNPDFYGEQKVPNGSNTTDYLLNFTITGSVDTVATKDIYGNFGAGNVVPANRCFLFTPKITGPGSYSLECTGKVSTSLNEQDYLDLGYDIIGDYIEKDTQYDTITYFVAAVGIQPWHNNTGNQNFQGYWSNTCLTHMFRYIPKRLKNYITDQEYADAHKIIRNGVEIGALQVLGKLNKQEKAFSVNGPGHLDSDTFVVSGTTWRLPQLIPEKTVSGYLICQEMISRTIYFVNIYNSPTLLSIYNNPDPVAGGVNGVITELNNNYQDYINDSNVMMTDENIKLELSSPSGTWTVFDGNSSVDYDNNQNIYTKQTNRREVANTDFIFENNNLSLNNANGRAIGERQFRTIDPTYILPDVVNATTMAYNW